MGISLRDVHMINDHISIGYDTQVWCQVVNAYWVTSRLCTQSTQIINFPYSETTNQHPLILLVQEFSILSFPSSPGCAWSGNSIRAADLKKCISPPNPGTKLSFIMLCNFKLKISVSHIPATVPSGYFQNNIITAGSGSIISAPSLPLERIEGYFRNNRVHTLELFFENDVFTTSAVTAVQATFYYWFLSYKM